MLEPAHDHGDAPDASSAPAASVAAWVAGDRRLLRVGPGRRVFIDLRGLQAFPRVGKIVAVSIWGRRIGERPRPRLTRLYSICTARGIAYVNVGPRPGTN